MYIGPQLRTVSINHVGFDDDLDRFATAAFRDTAWFASFTHGSDHDGRKAEWACFSCVPPLPSVLLAPLLQVRAQLY